MTLLLETAVFTSGCSYYKFSFTLTICCYLGL